MFFLSYLSFFCIFVPLPYPSSLSRMYHYLSFYLSFVLPRVLVECGLLPRLASELICRHERVAETCESESSQREPGESSLKAII